MNIQKIVSAISMCLIVMGLVVTGAQQVAAAPGTGDQRGHKGPKVSPLVVDLTDYRFRNDDGDEANATWMADQNTPVNLALNQAFRLRVRMAEITGGVGRNAETETSRQLWWQYRINDGEYSPYVTVCDSPWYKDALFYGGNTIERLQAPSDNYIGENIGMFDANSTRRGQTVVFYPLNDVEWEICLFLPAEAQSGDTVQFKVDYPWAPVSIDHVINVPTIHVI